MLVGNGIQVAVIEIWKTGIVARIINCGQTAVTQNIFVAIFERE